MTTTAVHVPATDFYVLDRPYTAAEYNALPCIGPNGEITRIVSLPLSHLLEHGADGLYSEMLCKAVVAELGEWQLYSYIAFGPATAIGHRVAEKSSSTGTWQVHSWIISPVPPDAIADPRDWETLFQVCMSPGLPVDDNDDLCLCDAILPCPVHDR